MKTQFFILLLFVVTFVSCSKEPEVPGYIGLYKVDNLRDECVDPTKNAKVTRTEHGICLNVTGGKDCIEITIDLREDGTYSVKTQRTELRGSAVDKKPQKEDTGPYSVSNTTLLLDPATNDESKLKLINNETGIDWEITNQGGCARLYGLAKS